MEAVQQHNVTVHFHAAVEFTESGVVDTSGQETAVDTIICATGTYMKCICEAPLRPMHKVLILCVDVAFQLQVEGGLTLLHNGAMSRRHTWALQYRT